MKILMLFPGFYEDLPPLRTAALCSQSIGQEVSVICFQCNQSNKQELIKNNISCLTLKIKEKPKSIIQKITVRISLIYLIIKNFKKINPSIIWFHSAHSFFEFLLLKNSKAKKIIHCHEYYNSKTRLSKKQNYMVKQSDLFITPEINRAWFIKTEINKNIKFHIIPNKPYSIDWETANNETKVYNCNNPSFIYQGLIAPGRNLENILTAFSELDFKASISIMGWGVPEYLTFIKKEFHVFKNIEFLNPIPYPLHLNTTKKFDFGIISYSNNSLNNIYCAPNKIFEYAFLGKPCLFPDYPGLTLLNMEYNIGEGCNMENINEIKIAIKNLIKSDYNGLKKNTSIFYSSVNLKEIYTDLFKSLI